MASRPILVGLLVLCATLAGCMGGSETPAPAPETNTSEDMMPDLANATVDDGTEEMPEELGHMPHLHDYWLGKDRVTIMDADVEVDQFTALAFTFFNTFNGEPGVGGTFFTLPEGSLVYEGTGKMEITASWTDPTVTGAGLRYRTPASDSFSEVVPLTANTPFALDIAPEMTDMPHDKESRWMFLLVPGGTGQSVVGKVHFRIDIVRVGDIALFPGHPELFGDANTLVLYDGAATSTSTNFASMIVGFASGNGGAESGVQSQKVVPMETLSMTANVTITSSAANIGEVSDVDFLYDPAGSFRAYRAQLLSSDPATGVYQFGWPVEMQQTDSPYSDTSQWRFDLLIHSEAADGLPVRGLADAQVDYQLQVVAYDTLLEGIDPVQEDEDDRR